MYDKCGANESGHDSCILGNKPVCVPVALYTAINPHTYGNVRGLAVLALLPSVVFQTRRGLVEYNLVFFRDGVREILNVDRDRHQSTST